jgi:hypothetical protein
MSNTDGPEPPFVGDAKCLKSSDDGHDKITVSTAGVRELPFIL